MSRSVAPPAVREALAGASRVPLWLDSPERPAPRARLAGTVRAQLAIVGGGFTGLWSALRALERDPSRAVVVLESDRLCAAASGRNGGFVEASVTHGLENGLAHFPDEIARLERLGRENLEGLAATLQREGIECGFERSGSIDVASAPWHLETLAESASLGARYGADVQLLDRAALRARVNSPTYLGGLFHRASTAIADPARLGWGLARAVEGRGGVLYEGSPVTALSREGSLVRLRTPGGSVLADAVVLATNAFPPLVRTVRRYVLPVYDYVLATEPLDAARLASIGWSGREGLSDVGNQFHYYRLTPDNRILFGGYDAIYYYGNAMGPRREQRRASFELLARHFLATFPQLAGVRFTHTWGGAIDTCSRFCAFFGTVEDNKAAYAAGFTGLGVGASRFAADVLLDLLGGEESERTSLEMVRTRPFPFPPEPLRWLVVAQTRRSLARSDANAGRRGAWLGLLDRFGIGFDS